MSADRHITSHTLCNERIAELEAELEALKDELLTAKRLNTKWMDECTEAIIRAERAEKALAGARLMPREKS